MDTSLPRATVISSEVRNLTSTKMGIDYQISIWFPPGYQKAGQTYPVIYLLDADNLLGMVSFLVFGLTYDQLMPGCLIVGIGQGVSSYDEWFKTREVDFSPPELPGSDHANKAPEFLSFIKDELIPFIETTYPTEPTDRCLAGYSLGGLFALYAFFHEPALFQKYLIGSAYWEGTLPVYLAYEERLAKQRRSLPVQAFFSVCSLEVDQLPNFHLLIDRLKRRNYAGLQMETLIGEGEKHASGLSKAYIQGFKTLYKPY